MQNSQEDFAICVQTLKAFPPSRKRVKIHTRTPFSVKAKAAAFLPKTKFKKFKNGGKTCPRGGVPLQ